MSNVIRMVYKCRACGATFSKANSAMMETSLVQQVSMHLDDPMWHLAVHLCGKGPRAGNVEVGVGDLVGARTQVEG